MTDLAASGRAANAETYGDEVQLSPWSYINVLLRHRYVVLAVPVIVAILAVINAEISPRQYLASAKFAPQERTAPEGGLGMLAMQLGVSSGRAGTSSPQFYSDLLVSREILRDAVRWSYKVPEKPFRGDLVAYFGLGGSTHDDETVRAVTALRGMITSMADRNGVVTLEVQADSPTLSLSITSHLLELVNDFNLRRRQTQARVERIFLEQRLAVAKNDLSAAEDALLAFVERNRALQAPELQAAGARLQREVSFRQQLVLTLAQSYEASKIEEVRSTPVLTVLERPEGFVAKQPRHALQKAILAALVALTLSVIGLFAWEFLGRTKRESSEDYDEFRALRHQFSTELRGILRGRFGSGSARNA